MSTAPGPSATESEPDTGPFFKLVCRRWHRQKNEKQATQCSETVHVPKGLKVRRLHKGIHRTAAFKAGKIQNNPFAAGKGPAVGREPGGAAIPPPAGMGGAPARPPLGPGQPSLGPRGPLMGPYMGPPMMGPGMPMGGPHMMGPGGMRPPMGPMGGPMMIMGGRPPMMMGGPGMQN